MERNILSGGTPDSFDDEWEQFSAELARAKDHEFDMLQVSGQAEQMMERVHNRVVESGIERFYDPDGQIERGLYYDFMQRRLTEMHVDNQGMDTEETRLAAIKSALIEYYDNRDIETEIYKWFGLIQHIADEIDSSMLSNIITTDIKKRMQAELWIHRGVGMDDERQKFIGQNFPGESFVLSRDGDSEYTAIALNGQLDYFRKRRDMLLLIDAALQIVGVNDDEEPEEVLQLAVGIVREMFEYEQDMRELRSKDPSLEANINAGFWDLARQLPRGPEIQRQIVGLFEQ